MLPSKFAIRFDKGTESSPHLRMQNRLLKDYTWVNGDTKAKTSVVNGLRVSRDGMLYNPYFDEYEIVYSEDEFWRVINDIDNVKPVRGTDIKYYIQSKDSKEDIMISHNGECISWSNNLNTWIKSVLDYEEVYRVVDEAKSNSNVVLKTFGE